MNSFKGILARIKEVKGIVHKNLLSWLFIKTCLKGLFIFGSYKLVQMDFKQFLNTC